MQNHLAFHQACEIFDLANGAVIVTQAGNTVERYSLGSSRENRNVNHLYLHHPDLLYKFILYFKEKAFELIKSPQQTPILPSANASDTHLKDFTIDTSLLKNFLDMIDFKNVSIIINNQDIQLPKKRSTNISIN